MTKVSEIMTEKVVTVPVKKGVKELIKLMLQTKEGLQALSQKEI